MEKETTKPDSGLPELSDQEIDMIAEGCARRFFPEMFLHPQPIDPAEFIEQALGFDLDYLYLSNCQLYLGLTCFKDIGIPAFSMETFSAFKANIPARTVIIDRGLYEESVNNGHEGRLRFTEAHEAGHILFHSKFFLNTASQTKAGENNFLIGASQKIVSDADRAEHQADIFASCFLIPYSSLKTLLDGFGAWRWDDRDKLQLVKETYNVSWPTAFYRLRKLGWLDSTSETFDWEEFSQY